MGRHEGLPPVPTLVFEDGALRPWCQDDAHRLVDAWADDEIARWNEVPADPTLATATRWIAGQTTRLERRLSIDLALTAGDDDLVVGEVGLSGFSDAHRGALIGYWLVPEARGQGLASRAVAEVCAWGHGALDLEVIVARCAISNTASQLVAARAGLVHEADEPSGNQLWRSRTRGS